MLFVAMVCCFVAKWFLRLSMLSGLGYVVASVFWIIATPLHSGFWDVIIGCCQGVAMAYWGVARCYSVIAKIKYAVRVLLCCC